MTIKVNQELCIGCGVCMSLCPKVFRFNSEGKAEAIAQEDFECAKNAAQSCPVSAISVE